ncbi:AraC family transcriptional regulator [Pseudomonas fluorescens]|uniref:HTH-type transcriptional regulator VirS n=1 Tax=Pseudomonas fluorescens TaxID=294 RepID=A0A5E7DHX4_PSEFL|nr:AraC family transcriptional regulator [Pseudomonas fluorescens]VVO15881.1 HTH-type transcriptional regulator VirS [Pseudomonas fluorescens]VVQ05632.1 HTH-type transcriptional regulator VirS [Pseudomonas fluorescens]
MYRMSAGYACVLMKMLSAQGLDVDRLCQESGLDRQLAAIPGSFCERSTIYRLLDLAAQASGDPNIGLRSAEHFHPGMFQIVGYTMMSSSNLKNAFERLTHFSPLIGTGFTMLVVQEQQHYRLATFDHHQRGSIKPRQYTDASLAALLGVYRWLSGSKSLRPLSVEFSYPQPKDIHEHQQLFGCELRFGAAYDSILFDGEELLRPLRMANEALAKLHESYANGQLDLLNDSTVVCRIRALIAERLSQAQPQGQCNMESIAAALSISKRTLQRALEKAGTQFTNILNHMRQQLADFYLRHSHFNMQHVTYLLGFHDHSSFHKACLRWFGMTPGQYRACQESLEAKGNKILLAR